MIARARIGGDFTEWSDGSSFACTWVEVKGETIADVVRNAPEGTTLIELPPGLHQPGSFTMRPGMTILCTGSGRDMTILATSAEPLPPAIVCERGHRGCLGPPCSEIDMESSASVKVSSRSE